MVRKKSKSRAMQHLWELVAVQNCSQLGAGVTDVLDKGDTPSCSASCHQGREVSTEGMLQSGARERKQTGEPLQSFLNLSGFTLKWPEGAQARPMGDRNDSRRACSPSPATASAEGKPAVHHSSAACSV